jgi:hypothetical protein
MPLRRLVVAKRRISSSIFKDLHALTDEPRLCRCPRGVRAL